MASGSSEDCVCPHQSRFRCLARRVSHVPLSLDGIVAFVRLVEMRGHHFYKFNGNRGVAFVPRPVKGCEHIEMMVWGPMSLALSDHKAFAASHDIHPAAGMWCPHHPPHFHGFPRPCFSCALFPPENILQHSKAKTERSTHVSVNSETAACYVHPAECWAPSAVQQP